jgi:hypothetical protein
MPIVFEGQSLTGGVFIVSGASDTLTHANVDGVPCNMNDPTCVGAAFKPFSVKLEGDGCNGCVPQKGDWIHVSSVTILLVAFTTYEWFLCGGKCHGSMTRPGFALGLEIEFATWKV